MKIVTTIARKGTDKI